MPAVRLASAFTVFCASVSLVTATPVALHSKPTSPQAQPNPKFAVSAKLNGATFVNKVGLATSRTGTRPQFDLCAQGLVGFGLIPSDFLESTGECCLRFHRHLCSPRCTTGDSLGGIGSAIALRQGSFKQNKNGTFSGTLVTQPDRGFNVCV